MKKPQVIDLWLRYCVALREHIAVDEHCLWPSERPSRRLEVRAAVSDAAAERHGDDLVEFSSSRHGFYLPNAYRPDPNLWAVDRQGVRVVKRSARCYRRLSQFWHFPAFRC